MLNLIIVESPSKAKTMKKFLKDGYEIMSSQGHICNLPQKELGIDIENDFKPKYLVDANKKRMVEELRNISKRSDVIYLASDDDREGEAISWHLKNILELDEKKTKRIVFHEITEKAIKKALEKPRTINEDLVNSQQARRILDRLVGYKVSPILWKKIKLGLSAGRVQSVAVRLIVDKEREILDFKTKQDYRVIATFKYKKSTFKSELKNKISTKEDVLKLYKDILECDFIVKNVEKKEVTKSPVAPFTTSTLQQEASTKLGYDVSKTMLLAQHLYEAGKISYMRTDSVILSEDAIKQAKDVILREYGKEYVQNRQYKNDSKLAQEAHEAIRPTHFADVEVSEDIYEQKLYNLIRNRALASQMADAKLSKTTITIVNNSNKKEYTFILKGETIEFDGFLKLYLVRDEKEDDDDENIKDDSLLPDLKVNDIVNSVGKVLLPVFAESQEDLNKNKEFMMLSIRMSSFILLPLIFGLIGIADNFVLLFLTAKWNGCVIYLRILSLVYITRSINTILKNGLLAIGKSGVNLFHEIVTSILTIVLILLAALYYKNIPMIAWSYVIISLVGTVIFVYFTTKYYSYTVLEILHDYMPSFLLSACMSAVVLAIGRIPFGLLATFILQLLTGILVYVLGAWIFKMKEFEYIINYLKRKG